jgi:hypothetical protein
MPIGRAAFGCGRVVELGQDDLFVRRGYGRGRIEPRERQAILVVDLHYLHTDDASPLAGAPLSRSGGREYGLLTPPRRSSTRSSAGTASGSTGTRVPPERRGV